MTISRKLIAVIRKYLGNIFITSAFENCAQEYVGALIGKCNRWTSYAGPLFSVRECQL